jgi:beta-1,2-mannobiose phosphorylase / 1,2-beta-oligomannan phosphorylase
MAGFQIKRLGLMMEPEPADPFEVEGVLSEEPFDWGRLGLATFRPNEGIEFDGVDEKDASISPVAIPDPEGKPATAIPHRPLFPGTRPAEAASEPRSREVELDRPKTNC